ncbi:MAG TPA: LytTR family DNA-binding domain-containing protein [Chitinophagales bacterium]|mgnify:CR=1 FL=1|nr:LytTR family DNA-binding domain-containing protein [Chitinophagales bacterium]HRK27743.1 LytTR family DNA-binding domain-containing protein [Chitinophagales bacterium]
MRILIIEDEQPAAKRLARMIEQYLPGAQIAETIDSVETAVKWLNTFTKPDLMFLDIQLSDGLSFDIFSATQVKEVPVIFTTTYDEYILRAFKLNSIDYLLKPIDPDELQQALHKYQLLYRQNQQPNNTQRLEQLLHNIQGKDYKQRLLVKTGQQLHSLPVNEIAYCNADEGLVQITTASGKIWAIDYTLDQLENLLNPTLFFRINRKSIIHITAIQKIHTYFNGRLLIDLKPTAPFETIVSRERVNQFKQWLDK